MKLYHAIVASTILFLGACLAETVSPAPIAALSSACSVDRKMCGGACVPLAVRAHGSRWDCNGDAVDGCEVDAFSDPQNCGYCGNDCGAAHGEGLCVRGACEVLACQSGWYDCDGDKATGCESDVPCE